MKAAVYIHLESPGKKEIREETVIPDYGGTIDFESLSEVLRIEYPDRYPLNTTALFETEVANQFRITTKFLGAVAYSGYIFYKQLNE